MLGIIRHKAASRSQENHRTMAAFRAAWSYVNLRVSDDHFREASRLVDVVRDEEGGALLELHDARQLTVPLKPGQCVKRAQRLIEQQESWPIHHGAGERPRHDALEL